MKIGKKFSLLTIAEYLFYIDNYKEYEDFNTLGLYRSLLENDKLNIEHKIQVRNHAHNFFIKTFDFLQLKDPMTYVEVSTLGQILTKGDQENIWNTIKINQHKILSEKRIKHRNFGTYSKHSCPYEDCIWNGLIVKNDSGLAWTSMNFFSDKKKYHQKEKSKIRKTDRKSAKQIIKRELEEDY